MRAYNLETKTWEKVPPGVIHAHIEDWSPDREHFRVYDPFDELVQAHAKTILDKLGHRLPERARRALLDAIPRPGHDPVFASNVKWRDVLTPGSDLIADGAQVLNTTTETIMCPDFTFGAKALEQGDLFEYTLLGNLSTVITTPGTITARLRWGGVGGTSLAASGAFAPDPTAAATTLSYKITWTMAVRAVGASGSAIAFAEIEWNDYDDASVTALVGNLNMKLAPVSAPAAVTIDTTTAKALSPTVAFSVATATTQLTNNIAILESLD